MPNALSSGSKILSGVAITAWKRDESVGRCGVCTKKFSVLRRKHHCRVCGDICCRRCLGFCLVDIPSAGIDLAYTCAKCIRRHSHKQSIVDEIAHLARSFDEQYERGLRRSRSGIIPPVSPKQHMSFSPTSVSSFGSALTPCSSPRSRSHSQDHKVIVSQFHHKKLHSVCSVLSDYLECVGGAIALVDDQYIWVLAYKGLRARALHSDTFTSICLQSVKSTEPFSGTQLRYQDHDSRTRNERGNSGFQFFAAAPIFNRDTNARRLGCVMALDTATRDPGSSKKVQKTMANLARLVSNILVEEKNILRIFSSGDFKLFASNALDVSPRPSPSAEMRNPLVSPASSPICSPSGARLSRSHSYSLGEETSFFSRYIRDFGDMNNYQSPAASRKHAHSNPEPKTDMGRPIRHRREFFPDNNAFLAAA
ncbi:TPA: hypothetical protein N0F65_003183 [Lagenidium giganteum]|uniref:FYVE-type domain-containing protein n=1 Tax=Lagenidium giganteum TaxID=4803 RepID=A0AAV2ZAT3_9STRA|nr:TPA: hypothetical protein N0F65_003183 [Lagenidium giganteum]